MTDIVDAPTRSRMMSSIRGKNTRPEILLRRALHRRGFRFRLHRRDLPGNPDIVLPKHRVVILVNGCFWHRHEGCRFATTPASRAEFWQEKFRRNVERDRRNEALLLADGWRIVVAWECALGKRRVEATSDYITTWLATEKGTPCRMELGDL